MSEKQKQTATIDPAILAQLQRADNAAVGIDPGAASMERKRQLLAKVRMLRDGEKARASMTLKGDPEFSYIWVFNHPDEISKFLGRQAQVVEATDPVETDFKQKDGRHYRGDTILMRMHRDLVEAWNADRDLRAVEASEGAKAAFDDWGASNGIPVKRKQ